MKKTELKQIAKNQLIDAIATAYYGLEEDNDYVVLSEKEQKIVNDYLRKLGTRMCRAINEEYITF